MNKDKIDINSIDVFVFDFDGVLTNNMVYLNEKGMEWVACNRADGLAFDILKKTNKKAIILSSEKNSVVTARAKKLKINVFHGIDDKVKTLRKLAKQEKFNLDRVIYIGNDLNDYKVMQICGFSACPSDSHKKIRDIASIVLKNPGGSGVVRELLEDFFEIDFIKILYIN